MESIQYCLDLINPEICEGKEIIVELKALLSTPSDDIELVALGDLLIRAERTNLWGDPETRNMIFVSCFYNLFCRPFTIAQDENYAEQSDVSSGNSIALLELALAAGGNPKFADTRGLTCLHWLAQRSDGEAELQKVMTILYHAGCNLEARDAMYGASALAWAAYQG
jgi:hypothetical protein